MVHIDESGFAADMPRLHGYSLRGIRCHGTRDRGARRRTNAIGAVLAGALLDVWLTESSVDSEIFNAWLEKSLLPCLPAGSVPVMDSAAFHRKAGTRALAEAAGRILEFLPTCSPDLNPIERFRARAKARIRRTGQTVDETFADPMLYQN